MKTSFFFDPATFLLLQSGIQGVKTRPTMKLINIIFVTIIYLMGIRLSQSSIIIMFELVLIIKHFTYLCTSMYDQNQRTAYEKEVYNCYKYVLVCYM